MARQSWIVQPDRGSRHRRPPVRHSNVDDDLGASRSNAIHAIATRASLSGLRMIKQLAMRPSTTSSVSTSVSCPSTVVINPGWPLTRTARTSMFGGVFLVMPRKKRAILSAPRIGARAAWHFAAAVAVQHRVTRQDLHEAVQIAGRARLEERAGQPFGLRGVGVESRALVVNPLLGPADDLPAARL